MNMGSGARKDSQRVARPAQFRTSLHWSHFFAYKNSWLCWTDPLNPHKCVLIKFARVPVSVRREKDWHLQYLKTKLWSQSHLCIQAQLNFLSEITNFVQNKINCLQVYIVIRLVYMYMLYTKTRLNRRIADRNRQYGWRRYKKEWVLVVTTLLKSFKFSFS